MNKEFPILQPADIIEVHWDEELRVVCDNEVEQFNNLIFPTEDLDFEKQEITRVWRLVKDDYLCIYKKQEN